MVHTIAKYMCRISHTNFSLTGAIVFCRMSTRLKKRCFGKNAIYFFFFKKYIP